MTASYLEPAVQLDQATHTAHAEFSLRNDSPETWRPTEGFAVSYHLFDAETGTLIVDGARLHPAHDVTPGQSERVRLDFAWPAEDGRYQVLVSPMRENVCWYYEHGWPFLLVEGVTENGVSRVDRVRVVTRATVRRERALRAIGRAFVLP